MKTLGPMVAAPPWAPWLVAIAAILPFLTALGGGFVSDARPLILANEALRSSTGWLVWFERDFYFGSPLQDVTLYRPLTVLSFLLHLRSSGTAPLPFLLGNLLLHAAVSVLVLQLGQRLVGSHAALLGALVFAVHPLHTEAVSWIMGRAELLAALFVLAACLSWLRALDPGTRHPHAAALAAAVLYLAACLSKEHAILLPVWGAFAALLVRPRPKAVLASGAAGALLGTAAFFVLRAHALVRVAEMPLDLALYNPAALVDTAHRWLSAAAVVARYALLLVWPQKLGHDYSFSQIPASTGLGLLELVGVLGIAAFLIGIALAAKRNPGLAIALALAPVVFFPVSNFPFAIGTIMAERLTYLPSTAVALLAGALVAPLLTPRSRHRVLAGTLVAIALLALAGRTLARNADWRDDASLYASARRVAPRSAHVLAVLSDQARARGDLAAALDLAEEALRIYPDSYPVRISLARIRVERGEFAPAAQEFRRALALAPDDARIRGQVRSNLGNVLAQQGLLAEAEAELREAIRADADNAIPRAVLAEILLGGGRGAEARAALGEAAGRDLRGGAALLRLASAALACGDPQLARHFARRAADAGVPLGEDLRRALERNP